MTRQNMWHLSFWVWVTSLNVMFSISWFHPLTCEFTGSIFLYTQTVFHCIDEPHFITHSSAEGPAGCFHFLAAVIRQAATWLNRSLRRRMASPLGICQGVTKSGHVANLFLNVCEFSILISREAALAQW